MILVRNQIVVEQKNQNITASINYALHIQQAILPDYHILKEAFVDFFMFYKPKDIVSGDFSLAYKYKKLRIEKHDLVKKHLNLAKNQTKIKLNDGFYDQSHS